MFKHSQMMKYVMWSALNIIFKRRNKYIDSLRPSYVLVMLNGFIGDVVQSTPILSALKRKWPEAAVDYCVYERSSAGLMNNPNIRKVIRSDIYGPWSLLKPLPIVRLARRLKRERYDLAICLGGDATYGIVARMAGIKYVAGLIDKEYKNAFLDLPVLTPYDDKQPRVEHYRRLGESIGLDFTKGLLPEVFWTKQDEVLVDGLINAQNKPLIAIFAGTGPNAFRPWAHRAWPAKNWIKLIENLSKKYPNVAMVLLGKGDDRIINQEITGSIKGLKIYDLTDKTNYSQMSYALSKCNLLISTDSSPVFAAAAVGCPMIVLYGPEWPERSQPVGAVGWHPVYIEMKCRDYCCSFPSRPPICQNECMKNIAVEMVMQAVNDTWKTSG